MILAGEVPFLDNSAFCQTLKMQLDHNSSYFHVTGFCFVCLSWQSCCVRTRESLQLRRGACCQRERGSRSHWLSACENAFRGSPHLKHSPRRADISWKGCQNIPTQIWKFEPLLSSLRFLHEQMQPTAVKIPTMS